MKSENEEEVYNFPYQFQSKVTKQGLITIPFSFPLKAGHFYIFELQTSETKIPYTQIKEVKSSNNRRYVSCRTKTPFLKREDNVNVTVIGEFIDNKNAIIISEEEAYPLLFNDTNRCIFLYTLSGNHQVLTSEEKNILEASHPNLLQKSFISESLPLLNQVTMDETEFYDVIREDKYGIIRYFGRKRQLSLALLTKEPTKENREAFETFLPFCFMIITRLDYLPYFLTNVMRSQTKLFLSKFQSIASYIPLTIREYSNYLQSKIYEIMSTSDINISKANSLDDIRFWLFIPSEFREIAKQIQLQFFSGRQYIEIEELIDIMKSNKEELNTIEDTIKRAIEWFYENQVLKINIIDNKKVVERYNFE